MAQFSCFYCYGYADALCSVLEELSEGYFLKVNVVDKLSQ